MAWRSGGAARRRTKRCVRVTGPFSCVEQELPPKSTCPRHKPAVSLQLAPGATPAETQPTGNSHGALITSQACGSAAARLATACSSYPELQRIQQPPASESNSHQPANPTSTSQRIQQPTAESTLSVINTEPQSKSGAVPWALQPECQVYCNMAMLLERMVGLASNSRLFSSHKSRRCNPVRDKRGSQQSTACEACLSSPPHSSSWCTWGGCRSCWLSERQCVPQALCTLLKLNLKTCW
jgi:hypothetical protein